MLRIIFALIIVIILAVMAMANKKLVSISYVLGSTSPLPLYLVLIVTFYQCICIHINPVTLMDSGQDGDKKAAAKAQGYGRNKKLNVIGNRIKFYARTR